jgi:hypothetical protein
VRNLLSGCRSRVMLASQNELGSSTSLKEIVGNWYNFSLKDSVKFTSKPIWSLSSMVWEVMNY